MLRLPERTTLEELATHFQYAKILTFGNLVLMAGYHFDGLNDDGYYGAIYEYSTPRHNCEDKICLVEVSNQFFTDDGHAIKWAINSADKNKI